LLFVIFWGVSVALYSVGFFAVPRELQQNDLTGTIPLFLAGFKLGQLNLANNQLCYSAAYDAWAIESDFVPSMSCQSCISPCQNEGTCSVDSMKMVCICPSNWLGETYSLPREL